jgi:hypothetical protein
MKTAMTNGVEPPLADATAAPQRVATGRRRLWQLCEPARDLLLVVAFDATWLRREASRVVGRMRHATCRLVGSDGDLLGAVAHDLGTRNPLSEALQRALDERHAVVVRALHRERDEAPLRERWRNAVEAGDPVPTLWALLTHPAGGALETMLLWDMRAWCAAQSARMTCAVAAHRQARLRAQVLQAEVDALRERLMRQQRDADVERKRRDAQIADLTGRLARATAVGTPPAMAVSRTDVVAPRPTAVAATQHASSRTAPPMAARWIEPVGKAAVKAADVLPPVETQAGSNPPVPAPLAVKARRVLCVGGMQHAVARYRAQVERLGGHFEHHDGGIEDALPRLDSRLARAEIVICQAGCINHEAYLRIKRHCTRTGTPCIYLERPSLARFAAALADGAASASATRSR